MNKPRTALTEPTHLLVWNGQDPLPACGVTELPRAMSDSWELVDCSDCVRTVVEDAK